MVMITDVITIKICRVHNGKHQRIWSQKQAIGTHLHPKGGRVVPLPAIMHKSLLGMEAAGNQKY